MITPSSARHAAFCGVLLLLAGLPVRAQTTIDLAKAKQTIRGFGGMNLTEPGEKWKIEDLTPEQAELAFGTKEGQLGLSMLRIRIPFNSAQWEREVRTVKTALAHGATVFATPWSAPADLKTNSSTVAGKLRTDKYGAYADHLLAFAKFMADHDAPLYAVSVQNEPDIQVEYESMDWTAQELVNFLAQQGAKFGDLKVIAPESYQMRTAMMDPILNSSTAAPHVDIVGGHIYGAGLAAYPLAQQKGKELWMTEHFTTSDRSANLWPDAMEVTKEVHQILAADFNAYVWWYIRRSYGLITEDGKVSKRGYAYSQYARFVRPGFARVDMPATPATNVLATAFKKGDSVVVVLNNTNTSAKSLSLSLGGGTTAVASFRKYTTSATKNVADDGTTAVANNAFTVSLDAQSVTTLVSVLKPSALRTRSLPAAGPLEVFDLSGVRLGSVDPSASRSLSSALRRIVPRAGICVVKPVGGTDARKVQVGL
jgi:glucuronoarabinoxylan endo-1,4-beta-xylanase